MYLLPKVRQLTVEEITQADTHSLKSLNKTFPGRPIIPQSGSQTYYIGKIIHLFLLPFVRKKKKKYMGQLALHTTDRITSGSF